MDLLPIEATVACPEFNPAQHAEARRIADLANGANCHRFLYRVKALVLWPDDGPLARPEARSRYCCPLVELIGLA
jgi:hypothetical protein